MLLLLLLLLLLLFFLFSLFSLFLNSSFLLVISGFLIFSFRASLYCLCRNFCLMVAHFFHIMMLQSKLFLVLGFNSTDAVF